MPRSQDHAQLDWLDDLTLHFKWLKSINAVWQNITGNTITFFQSEKHNNSRCRNKIFHFLLRRDWYKERCSIVACVLICQQGRNEEKYGIAYLNAPVLSGVTESEGVWEGELSHGLAVDLASYFPPSNVLFLATGVLNLNPVTSGINLWHKDVSQLSTMWWQGLNFLLRKQKWPCLQRCLKRGFSRSRALSDTMEVSLREVIFFLEFIKEIYRIKYIVKVCRYPILSNYLIPSFKNVFSESSN